MQFKIILTIFFAIFALISASDVRRQHFAHPDHPGKCYINADLILSPGLHASPVDKCRSYNCLENGDADVITSSPEGCL